MKSNKSTTSSNLTLAIAKGRIFEEAQELLEKSGIKILDYSSKSRKLTLQTNHKNLQILIVRAGDVPTYVDHGAADMGITGKDVLLESSAKNFYEILDLGISKCRMMVACKQGFSDRGITTRVATKYPKVSKKYFLEKGVQAEIIKLSGSMELAPSLGLADQIVDLVDTGITLRENGLEATDLIFDVSSYLIVNKSSMRIFREKIQDFIQTLDLRLEG